MERREGAPHFGSGREVGGDGGGRGGDGLEPFAIGPPGERLPCGPVGPPGVRGEGIGGGGPDAFHMGLQGRLDGRKLAGFAGGRDVRAHRCPLRVRVSGVRYVQISDKKIETPAAPHPQHRGEGPDPDPLGGGCAGLPRSSASSRSPRLSAAKTAQSLWLVKGCGSRWR